MKTCVHLYLAHFFSE